MDRDLMILLRSMKFCTWDSWNNPMYGEAAGQVIVLWVHAGLNVNLRHALLKEATYWVNIRIVAST